jgi:hypothetical protein
MGVESGVKTSPNLVFYVLWFLWCRIALGPGLRFNFFLSLLIGIAAFIAPLRRLNLAAPSRHTRPALPAGVSGLQLSQVCTDAYAQFPFIQR